MRVRFAIVLGLGVAVPGCAVRAAPYRFASPLVGAASLDERAPPERAPRVDDAVASPRDAVAIAAVPGPRIPGGVDDPGVMSGSRTEIPDLLEQAGGVVLSRLPEPHREPKAKDGEARITFDGLDDADDLRSLVGRRDGRSDVAFAIAAARALREGDLEPPVDGAALVELARTRIALAAPAEASFAPGDLLVFDRAVADAPASRVAVVLARDERGVVEMLYLGGNVVRHGFVDPARPTTRRDRDGRIVNSYLRHNHDQPPAGTRFLAGELLAHVVRWDLLTSSR